MKKTAILLVLMLLGSVTCAATAIATGFTDKDRALLIRLDERLNQVDKRFEQIDKRFEQVEKRIEELREDMNKRFEQVDKRFEDMNKRFEQVDKRFEDMNKRFDSMLKIMLGIVAAFASIVAVAIGFAIWDRRTMIRPFEDKTRDMEERISMDAKKLHNLVEVLRKYAAHDKKLAELLKTFSLL